MLWPARRNSTKSLFTERVDILDKLFELLGYLIDNDRGLTNHDTDYLKKLLNEAKKETCPYQKAVAKVFDIHFDCKDCPGKEERTNDEA